MIALASGWTVGWIVGAAVVVVAAVLLLAIISVARRITGETLAIIDGLDGVSSKTRSLHDVSRTQLAVARITNGLRKARGEGALPARAGGVNPGTRYRGPSKWARR